MIRINRYITTCSFTRILVLAVLSGLLIISFSLTACAAPRNRVTINTGNYRSYLYDSATQAKNGDILVFTRIGTTHHENKGKIVLFSSSDGGTTWGDAEEVELITLACKNP